MEQVILYTLNDKLIVVIPANDRDPKELLKTCVPKGCKGRIVNKSDLPPDRMFRNAWVDKGRGYPVTVDPLKAQNLRVDELRALRNNLLEKSDIELKIAEERNDMARKTALIKYRNDLRDMPENLEGLADLVEPKDIKAFLPEVLKRRMP